MKAVILCAGKGKRLRPFSYSIPKHLLPVYNQPVLRYLLNELAECGQVKEVAIIVSKETIDPIQEYVMKLGTSLPFSFTYLFQAKPLGLADACCMAEEFVDNDDFIMLLGDNIIPDGIKSIVGSDGSLPNSVDATVLVRQVIDPRPYGVVEIDSLGNVLSMEEKPLQPKSNLVIVGIYKFKSSIFSSIHQIKPSQRGELEITDAIFHLKKVGKNVKAQIFDGIFLDIGSPQSYLSANQYMIEHFYQQSPIDPTCKIERSNISWDVSIGKEATVIDSVLSQCIVLPGAIIKSSHLKNSIIGRNCRIQLNNTGEEAVQIIVGDESVVIKEV